MALTEKLPPWALWGGGVVLLLLLPLLFIGGGEEDPDEPLVPEAPPVSSEDEARTVDLLEAIKSGRYSDARILLGSSITRPFPPEAFDPVFAALRQILDERVSRDGLLIYSAALQNMVKRDLPIPKLSSHLRHLRQHCLSYGGRDLLAETVDPLVEMARLNESPRYRDAREEVLEHLLLFERWDDALPVFQRIADDRFSPRSRARAERILLGQHIARIAARSETPAAREIYQQFVDGMVEPLGLLAAEESRARSWLDGLLRYHAADRSFDRGAASIAQGVPVNLMSPAYVPARLDLTLALWDEARRREAGLRAEFLPADSNRARQLYQLGVGAAQLGDEEDLSLGLTRLSEDGGGQRQSKVYRDLLVAARDLLRGLDDAGKEGVGLAIAEQGHLLSQQDRIWWQGVADSGVLPAGDPGRLLFENGKIWWQLRHWERLERVERRLRREMAGARDLAALNFLKAISAYRVNDLKGVKELLLDILDKGPPPGLTRAEVGALLVLTEERVEELETIADLRSAARRVVSELVVEDSSNLRTKLALITLWQIDLDEHGHEFLTSELGKKRFDVILGHLDEPWLPFPLLERWLDLEGQLLLLADQLRTKDALDAALETTDAARRLVGHTDRYRALDGQILAEQGRQTSAAQGELRAERFRKAGHAFVAAASGGIGDQRYFYEAADAFFEAGDLAAAREALTSFSAHDRNTAEGERRFWSKFLLIARLERAAQRYDSAIRICAKNVAIEETGPLRYDFALERGRNLELRAREGDVDAALADYDFVYNGLSPKAAAWQEAVYLRAKILHERLRRIDPASAEGPAAARAALAAWEDLASRIDSEKGSPYLAEALFRAAEGRALLEQPQGARRHLRRLEVIAERVLATARTQLSPEQTAQWQRFAEKGAFSLADNYYEAREVAQARARYSTACREYSESPLSVWGYLQLGQLASDEGDVPAAQRHYQFALRKLESLEEADVQLLPPRWEKSFWVKTLQEKLADLNDRLTSSR